MDQPQITVRKQTYMAPLHVTGVDEQGRTMAICPQCGGTAHVEADGRVICEDWKPIQDYLDAAYRELVEQVQA